MRPFDVSRSFMDADEATLRKLVALLDVEPPDARIAAMGRGAFLDLLPPALLRRYTESHHADLLESAIALIRERIDDRTAGSTRRSYSFANLAVALKLRYERTGHASDLEEAIAASRTALSSGPMTGDERAGRIATLGRLLFIRAANYNSRSDLEEAIRQLVSSVQVPFVSGTKLAECWSDLAGALREKYQRTGDIDSLTRAVMGLRESVRVGPQGGPVAQINSVNLAGAVREHAAATGNLDELDQSTSHIETVVKGLAHDDPNLTGYLHSLGMGYLIQFRLSNSESDLRRAQSTLTTALERTDPSHQKYASIAMNAAEAFARDGEHPEKTLGLLRLIVNHPTAPAVVRFDAAETAGEMLLDMGEPREALPSWEEAVSLLPIVAWRGSSYIDRQVAVGRRSGTATAAAACAVAAGDLEYALGMAERGRAVLWNQLLDARADLSRIRQFRPDLADRLEATGAMLDATHYG